MERGVRLKYKQAKPYVYSLLIKTLDTTLQLKHKTCMDCVLCFYIDTSKGANCGRFKVGRRNVPEGAHGVASQGTP